MPDKKENLTSEDFESYQLKTGEEYMNSAQKAHFKSLLENWKKQLMEEVDRTVSHMKDEAANFPDPADRASQEEEFSLELRTRDRERKLIKKIDEALTSLESDDYGYCEACGVEIGVKRTWRSHSCALKSTSLRTGCDSESGGNSTRMPRVRVSWMTA